jgi:streptomycin 6-kinase
MESGLAIPPAFRRRIVDTWGKEGQAWLERLPDLIAHCAERWDLTVESRVPGLSYGFVAHASTADGTEAVLKLSVPNPELVTEIEALRIFRGRGVVELLEADLELSALLLPRVIPGTLLSHMEDDEEATRIAAPLIRDLPVAPPAEHPFPTLADWALVFNRLRTQLGPAMGPLPVHVVEKAEGVFRDLQASSPTGMLLHGDLHHDNILADRKKGWVVIDPKGVVGDPAFEAARLQINPWPDLLEMDQPQKVARQRLEILGSVLDADPSRLLAWAFFDAVLSACWSVEEGGENWRYGIACAELFDGIADGW